jgi:predicted metal-binding protein
MRPAPFEPKLHVLVCTNRREPGSPLGEGCGSRGDALYAAFKAEVDRRRGHASLWITRTHCLGVCPRTGATVAVHASDARPGEPRVFSEVEPEDAIELLNRGGA